jgi:hypothetical protein
MKYSSEGLELHTGVYSGNVNAIYGLGYRVFIVLTDERMVPKEQSLSVWFGLVVLRIRSSEKALLLRINFQFS